MVNFTIGKNDTHKDLSWNLKDKNGDPIPLDNIQGTGKVELIVNEDLTIEVTKAMQIIDGPNGVVYTKPTADMFKEGENTIKIKITWDNDEISESIIPYTVKAV